MSKRNGFTRFPNHIYDYILSENLTATQLKIVLAVCRNTYGWDKEYCRLSYSKLEEITKCSRRQLIRDTKELIERSILMEKYNDGERHLKFNDSIVNDTL